jgi:hypothetical protein
VYVDEMTDEEKNSIKSILMAHYGAKKVIIDNDLISVYGSNVDSVYIAVVVEYGHEYDVIYEQRNEKYNEVVLRLVKKATKMLTK